MTDMTPLNYILFNSSSMVVRFRGVHRHIKDEERIATILPLLMSYKEDPSEQKAEELIEALNPYVREQYSDVLDTDSTGRLFLKGTKVPLPGALEKVIKSYVDMNIPIDSLVNFWTLCMQNPSEVARDGFFKYVNDFGVVITDNGYALLYKAVNNNKKEEEDANLRKSIHFVTSQYLRLKGMKKSPKSYNVYAMKDDEENTVRFAISTHTGNPPEGDYTELGNLHEMYHQILEEGSQISRKSEGMYIPSRTGSHGNSINLGKPVVMPREQCDPDINQSCSYGLHVGSHKYVSSFGRSMDTILAVLVNPRDVVALPEYDHSKIRVCEYFPYAEIERDEQGNWEELDHGHFEEDFLNYEKEELEGFIKNADPVRKSVIQQRLVQISSMIRE